MNKIILEQLQNCKHCQLPAYDDDTTKIFIPKHEIKKEIILTEGHCYLIEIDDYVLNPPEGFTLSKNWNGGTNPPTKYMNVSVIKSMGKMFKVEGVGIDIVSRCTLDCFWTGWLPGTAVVIKEEI